MEIGDKVNVIDEKGTFIIKEIKGPQVILLDEYGFENIYLAKSIIPYSSFKELNFDCLEEMKKDEHKDNKSIIIKKETIRIIDLHIGHLVDSLRDIKPHQMLQKQINVAYSEIKKAKKDGIKKLILIHGKGKGVLKKNIYQLLQSIDDIEYFEADIMKYRFGAVEIRFK
ncbi:Smr/MutS family protein [Apibacter adventoris]|uniref:Smr/MutS family protein n=1 Tax=Apibacter adventoris TaxID=1679466 RepID=UPI000CF6A3C8|nr:Smr/MutS family protein [Apibacter adventoris]PQL95642.1 hypothetical protein C4S76_01965 [Apibacter adventoris]